MIYLSQFLDKTVMVLGLGRTGMSLVLNLLHCHCRKIYVYDDNQNRVDQILNGSDINSLLFKDGYCEKIFKYDLKDDSNSDQMQDIDCILVSPGIDCTKHPVIKAAVKYGGIKISNDIEEFVNATPNNTHIAISGTNGKSTTCSLMYHVLSSRDSYVQLGGNIGKPASDMIYYAKGCDYVLELSSFQLETLQKAKFDIVGITNVTEDHLDRYESFEQYMNAKESLYKRIANGGYALFSYDCVIVRGMYAKYSECKAGCKPKFKSILLSTKEDLPDGISIMNDIIVDNVFGARFAIKRPDSLRGDHNAQNLLFAYCVCRIRGIDENEFISAIQSFKPLSHRVEKFFENEVAIFVDDSKATNTAAMLKSVSSFNNTLLIVGGLKKDENLVKIQAYKDRVRACFVIGQDRDYFLQTLSQVGIEAHDCGTMQKALEQIRLYINNDVDVKAVGNHDKFTVLLCPGTASMDQYVNYMQRGNEFKDIVRNLF